MRDLEMPIHDPQPAPHDLKMLRQEIDAIDDDLLDLIERRVAASAKVAVLKDGESPGLLKLRPRREAEVVGRLQRAARRAPQEMVAHLWRTLMSYGLQAQTPVQLVVHAAGNRQALQECVRARFGPAATLVWADDAASALAVARDEEAVAILDEACAPPPGDGDLRVFDTIALRDGSLLCAVGRVAVADIVDGGVR